MAFRVTYNIPDKALDQFRDMIYWDKIESLTDKQLFALVIRYLKETPMAISLRGNMPSHIMGRHACDTSKDYIEFNAELLISEFPAILIHELLHGIFPQITEDDLIVKLERRVLKKLQVKDLNLILNLFFKNKLEYHGRFQRRVGTTSTERDAAKP